MTYRFEPKIIFKNKDEFVEHYCNKCLHEIVCGKYDYTLAEPPKGTDICRCSSFEEAED